MVDLKQIFENRISIAPKVRTISGVFIDIDENLEHTNYEPSYQRNYVWDDEKASYFIESIFLGTEVPPIILFKSNDKDGRVNYEVIDGRQRYQTILRFINNELKLKKGGLQKLDGLKEFVGKNYSELPSKYQMLFVDTKIRLIEYQFINDNHSKDEEDAVKTEIFQRYNSGITPLKTYEIDKAQYYYNDLNQSIKALLTDDHTLDLSVTNLFRLDKSNMDQKAIKIRELLVLHRIPIKYYSIQKQKVISRYFESLSTQLDNDDIENLFSSFRRKIDKLVVIKSSIIEAGISYNKLYAECLFWALSVLEDNNIIDDVTEPNQLSRLIDYLKKNESAFTTVKSSFANVLVGRYEVVSSFFAQEYNCSFKLAIDNNPHFKAENLHLNNKDAVTVESQSFEELRINKPEPTSMELTELLSKLKNNRFLLRPSYQRADVRNKRKSSSIIESMLLGIMLPPIFVYKREDGISEVIDGQQRLLSIISFIEETYKDENGVDQKPLLYGFKLDLGENAILKEYKGMAYKSLAKVDQNKIRKSSIYVIEISEERNKDFDPVDLFIRLNNKPYPISNDSFEMWNSFGPRPIIDIIKDSVRINEAWFYLRKNNARMENENLYSTLAYFQHQTIIRGIKEGEIAPEKTIEVYVLDKHIACRFKARNEITKLMYHSEDNSFQSAIDNLLFCFLPNVYELIDGPNKNISNLNDSMDSLLTADNGKRTQMMFYILWILLHDLSSDVVRKMKFEMRQEMDVIFKLFSDCSNVKEFKDAVIAFRSKYSHGQFAKQFPLGSFIEASDGLQNGTENEQEIILDKFPTPDSRFAVAHISDSQSSSNNIFVQQKRTGIEIKYLEAFLRSHLFFYTVHRKGKINCRLLESCYAPYISLQEQITIIKLLSYVDSSTGSMKLYFERLLDLLFYEKYFPNTFADANIHIMDEVKSFPDINENDSFDHKLKTIEKVYSERTMPNDMLSMYLLKSIDMDVLKSIESIERG